MRIGSGTKVLAFVLVSVLCALATAAVFSRYTHRDTGSFSADFWDVSGLVKGSDVRAAGVRVGSVEGLTLRDDGTVRVRFAVDKAVPMMTDVQLQVRFANLIGDRYLSVSQGSAKTVRPMTAKDVVPIAQTRPALDLDELNNGFKPLFQALSPQDVNALSASLIKTLQGEGGTIESLLGDVGSLTSTLATRDEVVGRVITNLNTVLGTVDERRGELSETALRAQQLVSGLNEDRKALVDGAGRIGSLAREATTFLETVRPELKDDLALLRTVVGTVEDDKADIDELLGAVPEAYRLLARTGSYGSFYNFYVCSLNLYVDAGDGTGVVVPGQTVKSPRCSF